MKRSQWVLGWGSWGLITAFAGTAFLADGTASTRECDPIITILGTNDIHGSVEPKKIKSETVGGLGFFHGVVQSIRQGMSERFGAQCTGTLVLDGGDQFQGTLLSNYNEGELVFDLMNAIGYDAIVPGNHDYDFGPLGWLFDQVEPGKTSSNPREVIEKLAARARFPLLSANTYLKKSLKDISGRQPEVESVGCASDKILDWSRAERPAFLKPYVMKTLAGVRVAIVGLDNVDTPKTTTPANVTDLCFRDPAIEYIALHREIKHRADVFVIVVHEGDANGQKRLTQMIQTIQNYDPDAVDAVVAGHTHWVHNLNIGGVPAIQSGANGERFGRIDLVFDMATGKVNRAKTQALAGAMLKHSACDPSTQAFCRSSAGGVAYERKPVVTDRAVEARIERAKKDVVALADRNLGTADSRLTRHRYEENALGNALVDGLREAAGVPLAFINTGGIRTDLNPGRVTYADLYSVLPFNNHAVVIGPMKTSQLVKLLERSMRTCGAYGSLVASGIRATFSKNCAAAVDDVDPNAKLLTVHLDSGEKIYDATGGIPEIFEKEFKLVTLDFLSQGGSGYVELKGFSIVNDLGIFREVLSDRLAQSPGHWSGGVDGRWKNALGTAGQ